MDWPKVETFELPFGQDYLWFPEWNTVALAPYLDEAGRDRALQEMWSKWRESVIRADPAA